MQLSLCRYKKGINCHLGLTIKFYHYLLHRPLNIITEIKHILDLYFEIKATPSKVLWFLVFDSGLDMRNKSLFKLTFIEGYPSIQSNQLTFCLVSFHHILNCMEE